MQLARALSNINTYYSADADVPSSRVDNTSSGSSFNRKKMRRFFRNSSLLPFIIVGIAIVAVLALAWSSRSDGSSNGSPLNSASNDKRVEIESPKATQVINRSFEFPLKDQAGKEVSKLKYEIQGAELRDEIVIKGERATAVRGKTFLVVNLKVTNSYDKSIQINVKDYVRLIVNNSNEKIAPDIHNDPVDVLAISTKLTRVGFPINDTDNNLTLQVGEIEGTKQLIKLNLK